MINAMTTLLGTLAKYDDQRGNAEIDRFRNMPDITTAIKIAAESRKENGHPYKHQQKNCNFWPDSITAATRVLLDARDELEPCSDFDELHELVKNLLSDIKFIGDLYCYDVAVRIGAFLDVLPERVYLHAGTRDGAMRLGLPTRKGVLEMSELPKPLQGFLPWQAEDILCRFNKDFLKQVGTGG
jgi:hypothetical protein